MKAIIETARPIPYVTPPVWIVVDPEEHTVRCNISVIDYKSKAEADYIAEIIRKAIEAAPEFTGGNQ